MWSSSATTANVLPTQFHLRATEQITSVACLAKATLSVSAHVTSNGRSFHGPTLHGLWLVGGADGPDPDQRHRQIEATPLGK
jgi:hypothetical protein